MTFILVAALLASTPGPADEHLLKGARAFRNARYGEALVEFRVAEKLGAGQDARDYAAAALVKLDRPLEALELFGSRSGADAVLEFYRALACYQAQMFTCADRSLEMTMGRFGPRVAEEARTMREQIRKTLATEITPTTVDWYMEHAEAALRTGKLTVGLLYAAEAREMGARRKDCHRCAEAVALEARARALEQERRK